MEENEFVLLNDDGNGLQAVLLTRPDIPSDLGAAGGYRLATMAMGRSGVRIYEAVSGAFSSPAGRNMHVALSFAEMDRLIEAYKWHRLALEEQERKYREAVKASDDFDPFLDTDHLP